MSRMGGNRFKRVEKSNRNRSLRTVNQLHPCGNVMGMLWECYGNSHRNPVGMGMEIPFHGNYPG